MKNELPVVVDLLNIDIVDVLFVVAVNVDVVLLVVVAVNVSQNENRQKTGNAEYRRKVFSPKNDFEKI